MMRNIYHLLASVFIVTLSVGIFHITREITNTLAFNQVFAIQTPARTTYYVSPAGDDTNPGTEAQPFRTIGKAASVAVMGDTVLIRAGIYNEFVKPLNSGAPGQYISYKSYGDGEVVIDAENGKRPGCIEVANKSYLWFSGLTLRGANGDASPHAGISITDGSSHIIVDNITAYGNYFGIMASGKFIPVRFITVINSKTFNPSTSVGNIRYGIFFYRKVYDSAIINNRAAYSLPVRLSFGIEISTNYPGVQADGARRILVVGNETDHNESQGIRTWNAVGVLISGNYTHHNGASGIQVENGSENIVIDNNLSEHNAQSYEYETGAWVDDSKNVVVRNNIFRNNKIGLNITSSDRVIVHDNYIYLNNRGAKHLLNASGLIVNNASSNVAITHNTFHKNSAAEAQLAGINFKAECTSVIFKNNIVSESASINDMLQTACGLTSDYNDFFNTRPLAVKLEKEQFTWTSYLDTSQLDLHSLTQDPLFSNPTAYDLRLRPASPLIGKGVVLAQTTSAGSGNLVAISDASYFSDGFGIGGGDTIMVGGNQVIVTDVDYAQNTITIDQKITWKSGDAVSFPFTGKAPNIGASEAIP